MIFNILIGLVDFVIIVLTLILPSWSLPDDYTTAVAWAIGKVMIFNGIFPVITLLQAILALLTVEILILIGKKLYKVFLGSRA